MQKITREQLIEKASELLANGTVSSVLGWGAGVVVTRGIVAVTGVATANDHAVGASLEGAEDEHGIDSAGARNADDLDVCGIRKTVVSRKVGARIGAPVAAKCND